MAKAKSINPPFAWLGRFWAPVGLGLVTIVAAFFRFFQIGALPPGLDETSARIGLQALAIGPGHFLPVLDSTNGYAPLWIWLQAIAVHLFGDTLIALQIWPALLGTLSVITMWLWLRSWFSIRVAWVGAFMVAVSPWAVTVSRNGLESAALPLFVSLTLWLSSRALAKPTVSRYAALAASLALSLLSGPMGWLLTVCIVLVGVWRLAAARSLTAFSKPRAVGAAIIAIGIAGLSYFIGSSLNAVKTLPHDLGIITTGTEFGHNLVKVALMFNVHGDENYRHNLAGEPLLNAFVGLMMVAGLLVCISRLHVLRYRVLLMLTLVLLIPCTLTTIGVPNSSWATGALPLVFALAGIGTAYMLEMWYATFPINSAARASGQGAVILLLALSLLQGYTQYFSAWAGSTPVYIAFNEGSVQIADHLKTDRITGDRYIVLPPEQAPVVGYLDYKLANYHVITPAGLTTLPVGTTSRQFYIVAISRDEAVKALKAKFPGGVLHPHYSAFNLVEIYYTYDTVQ